MSTVSLYIEQPSYKPYFHSVAVWRGVSVDRAHLVRSEARVQSPAWT